MQEVGHHAAFCLFEAVASSLAQALVDKFERADCNQSFTSQCRQFNQTDTDDTLGQCHVTFI